MTRGKKPAGDVVIDATRCQFVAHVSVAAVGERVRVKTSDTVVHQPRGIVAKATVFNLALPRREQTIDITRRLTRPAAVRMICEAHAHMAGWLIVHDSPYYAVTDERGAYHIDGIPPGAYRVVVWHEGFRPRGTDRDGRVVYDAPRTMTKEVTIAPRGATTADFELR
ncbi:MAG: carboxypeptidase regulatory-like domain-containing protein [Candidatus Rokubacteria bacterium]|nr:carboxypeptidase regulatory-like domain-containing protein [Candidatus Rokubacteria bacterium]